MIKSSLQTIKKYTLLIAAAQISLALLVANIFPISAVAIGKCALESVATHTEYYDPCRTECSDTNTPALPGKDIYILGDSITVGAAARYHELFGAQGANITISAVSGRSWVSGGNPGLGSEGTQGSGQSAITNDSVTIQKAGQIVVALGTNGLSASNPVADVIESLRKVNPSAPIWWVNIANSSSGNGVDDFNSTLQNQANISKFGVIDWRKTVDPTGDGTHNVANLLADGIHPRQPDGVNALANLVVSKVMGRNNPLTGSANCVCKASTVNLVGSNEVERAFNFFLAKGLSAQQAAGILGNLMLESGGNVTINPKSVNSIGAYGIAQWLGGRRTGLNNFAASKNAAPDDLGIQLDFLWSEIENGGQYNVLAVLKTKNTPAEAAQAWDKLFERSEGTSVSQRIKNADSVFAKYGSNSPGGGATTTSNCKQ